MATAGLNKLGLGSEQPVGARRVLGTNAVC